MSDRARAVMNAWTDPGPVPRFHEEWQDRLRRHWPTLADALDRFSGQMLADYANGHVTVKAADLSGRHAGKEVSCTVQPGIRATGVLERIVVQKATVILVLSNLSGTGMDGRYMVDAETDVEVWR